ncbi:hypothetical protein TresaDRAFT_2836, partial [Treponema saccharophilum DSM 2985]
MFRRSEFAILLLMRNETGAREIRLTPKSPRKTRPSQSRYCIVNGLSSP